MRKPQKASPKKPAKEKLVVRMPDKQAIRALFPPEVVDEIDRQIGLSLARPLTALRNFPPSLSNPRRNRYDPSDTGFRQVLFVRVCLPRIFRALANGAQQWHASASGSTRICESTSRFFLLPANARLSFILTLPYWKRSGAFTAKNGTSTGFLRSDKSELSNEPSKVMHRRRVAALLLASDCHSRRLRSRGSWIATPGGEHGRLQRQRNSRLDGYLRLRQSKSRMSRSQQQRPPRRMRSRILRSQSIGLSRR